MTASGRTCAVTRVRCPSLCLLHLVLVLEAATKVRHVLTVRGPVLPALARLALAARVRLDRSEMVPATLAMREMRVMLDLPTMGADALTRPVAVGQARGTALEARALAVVEAQVAENGPRVAVGANLEGTAGEMLAVLVVAMAAAGPTVLLAQPADAIAEQVSRAALVSAGDPMSEPAELLAVAKVIGVDARMVRTAAAMLVQVGSTAAEAARVAHLHVRFVGLLMEAVITNGPGARVTAGLGRPIVRGAAVVIRIVPRRADPTHGTTCALHSKMIPVTGHDAPSRTGHRCHWTASVLFGPMVVQSNEATGTGRKPSMTSAAHGLHAHHVSPAVSARRINNRISANGWACRNRPGSKSTCRLSQRPLLIGRSALPLSRRSKLPSQ